MFQALVKILQNKRGKRKQADINQTNYGCWQTPPNDILENILQRLNISDRIRLSIVCKSWRAIVMCRDIRSTPQFPWLVLPQRSSKYLSFSSLSEGKVVEMKLPKRGRGWFYGSSKGWLIMVKEQGLNSKIILLNPISRAQFKLPSLSTITSFQNHVKAEEFYPASAVRWFLQRTVVSSSSISKCIVATIFYPTKELCLCKPGGKSWSVFQLLDDIQNDSYVDILFSCGMLYALVEKRGIENGSVTARPLNFGDGAVEVKLVYKQPEEKIKHGQHVLLSTAVCKSYLLESTTGNEVLLIHQTINHFDQENASTSDLMVYKIDPENDDNFLRVRSLGNQMLFLAEYGSGYSLASDFKGLKGNCIYFQEIGFKCSESGIFYLDGGNIERSFPSVGNSTECGLSWFSPSF